MGGRGVPGCSVRGDGLLLHAQADLRARIGAGEVPREIRDAPFVQVPLGVTEDRLVGTVDIEASMKVGKGCFLARGLCGDA